MQQSPSQYDSIEPMSDVVSYILFFQAQIKVLHWTTRSYDRHKNYDKLHERFNEQADKFVEVYLGKHGRNIVAPGALKNPTLIVPNKEGEREFGISVLATCVNFFLNLTNTYIKQEDSELLNIRDEILSVLYQSKYLLELH